MCGMKHTSWASFRIWTSLIAAAIAFAPCAIAQTASIEFVAHATPSGGLEEPVRGFPFFLLSKSFADVKKEAEAAFPKPDMAAFIAKQDVSKELKAWMKKNNFVTLSGENFIRLLHPDDILNIPEFKKAYMDRNSGDNSADFPKPKYKASDQTKDPAKYQKLSDEYIEAIRHYIEGHPESVDGLDLNLSDIDPGPKWTAMLDVRVTAIHRRALDLAQSTYLVARAQTNLDGQGFMRGIAPGNYWLGTLDVPATVGDARPVWDVPVALRAGETKYVALSDSNAVRPPASQ
jgi:hypothetical protein